VHRLAASRGYRITRSALASTFGGIVRTTLGSLKPISKLISQAAHFFNPRYAAIFFPQ
jgi:hypothetical protein